MDFPNFSPPFPRKLSHFVLLPPLWNTRRICPRFVPAAKHIGLFAPPALTSCGSEIFTTNIVYTAGETLLAHNSNVFIRGFDARGGLVTGDRLVGVILRTPVGINLKLNARSQIWPTERVWVTSCAMSARNVIEDDGSYLTGLTVQLNRLNPLTDSPPCSLLENCSQTGPSLSQTGWGFLVSYPVLLLRAVNDGNCSMQRLSLKRGFRCVCGFWFKWIPVSTLIKGFVTVFARSNCAIISLSQSLVCVISLTLFSKRLWIKTMCAAGAMGGAFAHAGQQAPPWGRDNFRAVFDAV